MFILPVSSKTPLAIKLLMRLIEPAEGKPPMSARPEKVTLDAFVMLKFVNGPTVLLKVISCEALKVMA